MRLFSLLTWVTQLGFSVVCPPLFMLWLAGWIRDRYGIGSWLTLVLGAIGLLISFRSVQSLAQGTEIGAGIKIHTLAAGETERDVFVVALDGHEPALGKDRETHDRARKEAEGFG